MTDNGAMSFTEGSEPIQLTDAQRIEKEALERYPKKAINGFEFPEYNVRERSAYIAGATAERERKRALTKEQLTKVFHEQVDAVRKEERNKAIDECRHEIALWLTEPGKLGSELMERITALKADSK